MQISIGSKLGVSSDGSKMVICPYNSVKPLSFTNYGQTWTPLIKETLTDVSLTNRYCTIVSGDGAKILMAYHSGFVYLSVPQ